MIDLINTLLQGNLDGIVLAASGALGAGIALGIGALFNLLASLAAKTKTTADDKIVSGAKNSFKEKVKDV